MSFALFAAPSIHAATSNTSQILRVSPIIINVQLSPGKVYPYTIALTNLTDKPLPLHASLNDFLTTGEEGGYVFEESRTNPLLSWVHLEQSDVILAAGQSKKITLTITTPQSIPLGGYYGMLFFEPVLQSANPNATHVIPRVGVLMLANIGVPDQNAKNADILTFATGLFQEDTHIPLLLRVQNTSLHFYTAKPILTFSPLLPLSGPAKPPQYLEDKIIFQGKIRRWEQTVDIPYSMPNIYLAHMAVSTGNGKYVTQDNYIIVFPYKKTAAVAVALIAVLFIIIKRKRLKKALRALLLNK